MEKAKCYVVDLRQLRKDAVRKLLSKGTVINCAGVSFLVIEAATMAAGTSGIDIRANELYKKLLTIGKWVIIGKGAIETIKCIADGDLQNAKKSFLGYFLIYGMLALLPWGMNQVEKALSEMDVTAQ